MATKHSKVVIHLEGPPPINSYNPLNKYVYEWSCDKLKISFIHYHNAYGQKTYQGDDIPQGASIHKLN